ncbi:NAD-dependent epimerase/dehydratase family protein [Desulfofundulus thermosubterraneus]|uniref:Nucleoside-diphosphate-sugar epimerase n=1 Tax=Desulfofundulus thermosubterraneus DSM 16057 TaxID=1121432 RepID=A0A1M6EBB1_9FIRM|nr:NAD(P)-dependent oxidoreductase [Desulfofundulus thermosubterraneus]SHI82588.1 Nucleoside-diphosphate-sugar epimerase [Desulfofundulus thermosubterraneus DSM 16057]
MKILITGGAGNIGRELAEKALAGGNEVTIFDLPQANYEGLENRKGITIIKGSINDPNDIQKAVKGVDAVIHLAALMPHLCTDREKTMTVNVGGTQNVLDALLKEGRDVQFVFSSSVSTYGDTQNMEPPVKITNPQNALDLYAESKIEAEKVVFQSGIPYTVLRISGVVIPAFYDPNPWQFMKEQRIELINRTDVVTALYNSATLKEARNKIFNIAGGREWQMLGYQWAQRHMEVLGFPFEEAEFMERPGWLDWYDTRESQDILKYQNTTVDEFFELLSRAVEEFLNQ